MTSVLDTVQLSTGFTLRGCIDRRAKGLRARAAAKLADTHQCEPEAKLLIAQAEALEELMMGLELCTLYDGGRPWART